MRYSENRIPAATLERRQIVALESFVRESAAGNSPNAATARPPSMNRRTKYMCSASSSAPSARRNVTTIADQPTNATAMVESRIR
jgi:hypothetical protein